MQRQQNGFSLLEMVVAVSIMLILAVVGFIAYQSFTDNARQAAVENAAGQVYTAARAYMLDHSSGTAKTAEYDYNNSQLGNDRKIIATVTELNNDRLRVVAQADDSHHMAIRETPSEHGGGSWESDNGTLQPPTGATNINMTYQCSETTTGHLAIINIDPSTVVTKWETSDMAKTLTQVRYGTPDASFNIRPDTRQEILKSRLIDNGMDALEADLQMNQYIRESTAMGEERSGYPEYTQAKMVQNASEPVTMRAGVEYSISYDGDVETFAAPGHEPTANAAASLADCLISIDHFGNSTNLKNIVYLGGDKLESVPTNIPPTVLSLRGAFENTTNFNDPNVRYWQTDNVVSFRSLFNNSTSFNQDIRTWTDTDGTEYWNAEKVVDSRMMFYLASAVDDEVAAWTLPTTVGMAPGDTFDD